MSSSGLLKKSWVFLVECAVPCMDRWVELGEGGAKTNWDVARRHVKLLVRQPHYSRHVDALRPRGWRLVRVTKHTRKA